MYRKQWTFKQGLRPVSHCVSDRKNYRNKKVIGVVNFLLAQVVPPPQLL